MRIDMQTNMQKCILRDTCLDLWSDKQEMRCSADVNKYLVYLDIHTLCNIDSLSDVSWCTDSWLAAESTLRRESDGSFGKTAWRAESHMKVIWKKFRTNNYSECLDARYNALYATRARCRKISRNGWRMINDIRHVIAMSFECRCSRCSEGIEDLAKLLVYDIDIYLLLQKDTNVRYKTARAIS